MFLRGWLNFKNELISYMKIAYIVPKDQKGTFFILAKTFPIAHVNFSYSTFFWYDDECCHLQESLNHHFFFKNASFKYKYFCHLTWNCLTQMMSISAVAEYEELPIQSGNLFARVTKNSLQIEWVKFQVVWSITFYSTGMRSRSKSWTAECPGLSDPAGAWGYCPPPLPHCVLKWGFKRTFPGNQDATLK